MVVGGVQRFYVCATRVTRDLQIGSSPGEALPAERDNENIRNKARPATVTVRKRVN
jgi:hypothetical protein